MPLTAPPADLPIRGESIASFLDLLSSLLEDNLTAEFVILLLTGQYNGEQVSVEALRNRIYNEEDDYADPDELYKYHLSRDIDSALGISDNICVENHSITFYVIPRYSGSLRSSVGLSRSIDVDGTPTLIKLHKIPNSLFASWDTRNEILIFFPGLYKKGERDGYKVNNSHVALFFENVTRPALLTLMPDLRAVNFPPTFDAEMWRARSEKGHIVTSGRMLSADVVRDLSGELRTELASALARGVPLHWAAGFFFLHQIKGVKDANAYHPVDAEDALDYFIDSNHLSREAIESQPDQWYIDLGLELSSASAKDSLAWRADSHTALLSDVLDIPANHAARMTKVGSTSYYKDPTSHLTEVAGCRITPGVRGRGPLKVAKMQAYHTDKAITATVGGGYHAKHITLKQLLNEKEGGFLEKLFQVNEESRQAGMIAKARLEIRIPFSRHSLAYAAVQTINWRKFLVAIPCADWWLLRIYPLIAYQAVAEAQLKARPVDRTNIAGVALLMTIVWLVNSLHATPDTGPSSRQLLGAVLPHRPLQGMAEVMMPYRLPGTRQDRRDRVEDEEEEDQDRDVDAAVVRRAGGRRFPAAEEEEDSDGGDDDYEFRAGPAIPFGIVFLRSVLWDDATRIPILGGSALSPLKENVFEYFSGVAWSDFVDTVYNGALFQKRSLARTRTNTRQRPVILEEGEEIPVVFSLRNGNRKIEKPEWQDGDIAREEPEEPQQVTRNEYLSQIYHQLFVDAICLSPSPHGGGGAYTKIAVAHRTKVTAGLFKSNNPGQAFHQAHMRLGSDKEWETAFNNILPPQGRLKMGNSQNYPRCAYYKMWGHFISSVPSTTAIAAAREAVKEKFLSEVMWFPWAKSERLWESNGKSYERATHSPGLDAKAPAPWLLIRGGCAWKGDVVWTPEGTRPVADDHDVIEIDESDDED